MSAQTVEVRARSAGGLRHVVEVRQHEVVVDEPPALGGGDTGPTPQELLAASLASCTAATVRMFAERKGWDLGEVEVECRIGHADRGCPTRFELVLHLDEHLDDEQVEKARVIMSKCPVHRLLDGEVMFSERVERLAHAG